MRKQQLRWYLLLLLCFALFLTACNTQNQGAANENKPNQATKVKNPQNVPHQNNATKHLTPTTNKTGSKATTHGNHFSKEKAVEQEIKVAVNHDYTDTVHAYQLDGKTYIPIKPLLEILGFHIIHQEDHKLSAGFTDELIHVESDGTTAIIEGKHLFLNEPVLRTDSEMYATVSTLQQLFGDLYHVNASDHQLHFNADNQRFGFPKEKSPSDIHVDEAVPALSSTMADQIILTAKKYVGTPYVFGAAAGQSRTFDCASFVQYVYAKHGIKLPRVSRVQAKLGTPISVNNLQKGDLLFFYWPGRFASNNIVGHVAIYIGNGYMIQATPSRGVHIANFSQSAYWKRTFLGAKRISGA
ncbi:C40 family peptidase [Rubeoparvulum massiliense]|uniref:C40 family peptidase n=1 Tax=Rubeoparvulum massiliense TaxID=1631346 RepID=UPI00069E51B6|nr:C40 family peptidase [Rubeoparvulum massiliense]